MKQFIVGLTDEEAAAVVAAMKEVAVLGLPVARHPRDDIYEVRAEAERRSFRLFFAKETNHPVSLHGFAKQTQKTPPRELDLAERRLKDWRNRGG